MKEITTERLVLTPWRDCQEDALGPLQLREGSGGRTKGRMEASRERRRIEGDNKKCIYASRRMGYSREGKRQDSRQYRSGTGQAQRRCKQQRDGIFSRQRNSGEEDT